MQEFIAWLKADKSMSERAAHDVCSRLKRVYKLLNIEDVSPGSVEQLNSIPDFTGLSMFIKSQLKRAVNLKLEYQSKNI